jgi:hypothetical protein
MASLVACLGNGKGTWAHVAQVIDKQEWEKIFLVTNSFGVENFKPSKQVEYIIIDENKFLPEIIEDITKQLKGKIAGTEVALNMISGAGKEHMAVLSAIIKTGLGVRLVALTTKGIKEI